MGAILLLRRFGGRRTVEWEGADGPPLPSDRDGRSFSGKE